MSFDKNYPNRKDKRKPYRKAKAIDPTCRNHGSCPYCRENRTHQGKRISKDKIKQTLNDISN
jgi:hypothetical protein